MLHPHIHCNRIAASLLALAALLPAVANGQKPSAPVPQVKGIAATKARLVAGYGRLPLAFEPNVGQVDRRVRFLTHTGQGTLFLTDTEAVLTLPCKDARDTTPAIPSPLAPKHRPGKERPAPRKYAVLRMKLTGAHKPVATTGLDKLPGIVNYYWGNDPKRWHSNVPTYRQAKFTGVYKGVDLLYYGAQNGKLEYDFVVKPGADPKAIRLAFSGATGARVTPEGDLALQTSAGEVCWQRPVTYQMIGGHREAVACAYELKREGHQAQVGFRLARYDASRPVVIDPSLAYSTYLGGSEYNQANGIAVDGSGNACVTGYTESLDFPIQGAFQSTFLGVFDAFVTKLSAAGSSLVYSTYLGGAVAAPGSWFGNSPVSYGYGIAIDSSGSAYLTGATTCTDFPATPGAFQTILNGQGSGFLTKLSTHGTLVYSTFLGGASPNGIAVDGSGNAYVTGAAGGGFPTTPGAFQTTLNTGGNGANAFVTKLSTNGSSLVYSTYLGGSGTHVQGGEGDQASSIAVDSSGNAYVTGQAYSTDFPTTSGAFQTSKEYNIGAAFITKLSVDGDSLVYSTFLSNGVSDYSVYGSSIAVDDSGNAYVTGETGFGFPTTPGAFQPIYRQTSGAYAFVTKLNANGSSLVYSTYLGGDTLGYGSGIVGDSAQIGNSIAVDNIGNAYVTGYTDASNFPTTTGGFQRTVGGKGNGDNDAFMTELSADGSSLVYSSFLGGTVNDEGYGIAVDASGNAYVTGYTSSSDFPTTKGAFQRTNKTPSGYTAFVTKFPFSPSLVSLSPNSAAVGSNGFIVTLNGNHFVPGATVLCNGVARSAVFVSSTQLTVGVTAADLVRTGVAQVSVQNPAPQAGQSNTLLFTVGQPQLQLTGAPQLTRNGGHITVSFQVTNVGNAPGMAQLTAATLNGVSTLTSPLPGGTIPPGVTVNVLLDFSGNAGNPGQVVTLQVNGTLNGNSLTVSQPVTLP